MSEKQVKKPKVVKTIDYESQPEEEITDPIDDIEQEVIEDEILKEAKAIRFFQGLKNLNGSDYLLWVYRKDKQKQNFLFKTEDLTLDPEEIRNEWGGGSFQIYLKAPNGDLKDTIVMHIESKPGATAKTGEGSLSKQAILEEMKMYKDLFGGNGNSTDVMLMKLMEMQNQTSERFMKMQMDSERKTSEMMLEIAKMSNKPSGGFKEMAEMVEVLDSIRGSNGSDGDDSILQSALKSPVVAGILQSFALPVAEKLVSGERKNVKQLPGKPVEVDRILEYVKLFPDEYITYVTKENRDACVKDLIEQNKDKISEADCNFIIDRILEMKG